MIKNSIYILKIALLIILLHTCNLSWAADPYYVGSEDLSKLLLGKIFGGRVGSIYLGGGSDPLLGRMFLYFNTIIVTFGLTVISYVSVVSIINTAQEGEVLGKKWSSIWIILRTATGMGLLAPVSNGYSAIQIAVIWIVVQGIGAANLVYNVFLEEITSATGSTLIGEPKLADPTALDKILENSKSIYPSILAGTMCANAFNKLASNNSNNESTISIHPDILKYGNRIFFYESTNNNSQVVYNLGNPNAPVGSVWRDVCGSYTVQNFGNNPENLAKSKNNFASILRQFYQSSNQINSSLVKNTPYDITKESDPWSAISNKVVSRGGQQNNFQILFNNINGLYVNTFTNDIASANKAAVQIDANKKNQYSSQGWIMTPLLLMESSKQDTEIKKYWYCDKDELSKNCLPTEVLKSTSDSLTNIDQLTISDSEKRQVKFYINMMKNSANLIPTDSESGAIGGGFGGLNVSSELQGKFNALFSPLNKLMSYGAELKLDPSKLTNNPFRHFVEIGGNLMSNAENALLIQLGVSLALLVIGIPGAMGNWLYIFAALFAIASIGMMLLAVAVSFWSFGAILGIYTPLIPFMFFAGTSIAWMFLVIEAIVAAPILALGLITPGGDYLGKTEQGIVIITNIFLRPVLMMFGFILALKLLSAAMFLVMATFFPILTLAEQYNTIAKDLFGFYKIIILFIYVTFSLALVNKIFSLIYILPDNIMRWIGGQAEQGFGIEQLLSETKQQTSQAGEGATGLMKGVSDSMMQKANQFAKRNEK